jgi:acetyl esterase/lipase
MTELPARPSWQSWLLKPTTRLLQLLLRPRDPSYAARRAASDRLFGRLGLPPGVRAELEHEGSLELLRVTPPELRHNGVLLYLHGGAYVLGSLTMYRPFLGVLASAMGMPALAVAYRLAPEHPFPAALDDALAAFDALLRSGVAPGQIVVMGDSAGGGLAVALLLQIRDSGRPFPAGALLLSPWLDLSLSGESVRSRQRADPVLDTADLRAAARAYLGDRDSRTPLASPLFGSLSHLPPLLIQVGTEELLLDDSRRFAAAAQKAGVAVTLQIWPGMTHGWHTVGDWLPETTWALTHCERFAAALVAQASPAPAGRLHKGT